MRSSPGEESSAPASPDRCCRWVDPFIGTEAIDLPEPQGTAATWFYLKARIGNTHPGACLPLSPVTACPYSGAYVTGYGRYGANTHGSPPRIYEKKAAFGVTHVHHWGTGNIHSFYNFLLTMPYRGWPACAPAVDLLASRPYDLADERAEPGCCSALLRNIDVRVELTVADRAAAHRYGFACSAGGRCGGSMVHHGVQWHFALLCPAAAETILWRGTAAGAVSGGHLLQPVRCLEAAELALDEAP